MRTSHVMVCGHCGAHVELPEADSHQGRIIDWFTQDHAKHLQAHENIGVVEKLIWACMHAAAFEPTDALLKGS